MQRVCIKCNAKGPESDFRKGRNICLVCQRQVAHADYLLHRDKRIAKVQQHYAENKEKKLAYQKEWYDRLPPEKLQERRKLSLLNTIKLRTAVFAEYGGRCVCCGERETMFLTIDHINGNGNQHRKAVLGSHLKAGTHFYRWLRQNKYPSEFQLLCFNCNMGRHRNKGICPHKARLGE